MLIRSEAICLRTIDYSETSQVVRLYSRLHGKLSCIAKGSKRKKSAFLGPFGFLGVYDLIRMEKQPGELDLLTRAELIRDFRALGRDYDPYCLASYVADFVDAFTLDGQVVEGLYDLAVEALDRLEKGTRSADLLFSFEARALMKLGFAPRLRECGFCRSGIGTPEAYFAPRDGGVVCLRCRPRDIRRFLVRRATLESIARFGAGEMPREEMKASLVEGIRMVLDAVVMQHLEKKLTSARFMRSALGVTSSASAPSTP